MSLCLNMIVKNEAHVIRRCLDSVRPYVSHWVIVDTGSTDGTQDVIREHMHDIPGTLHERPWRDFGHNRSEAIALARGHGDYALVMDADHVLHVPDGFTFEGLDADAYYIEHRYAGVNYVLGILLGDRIAWRYEGVLHEYPTADVPHRFVPLRGPWIQVFHEGARSKDPQTYRRDIAVLEEALAREPGNARYAYYLAQSLKDSGELERALAMYERRAGMQGWEEETWQARYQAALLIERLGRPPADVHRAYFEAFKARPIRAEPLVQLARWHRLRQEWAFALLFARAAANAPRPADRLFVEDAVYAWRAQDELSVAAFYAGSRQEGHAAALRALAEPSLPAADRKRLEDNLRYYEDGAGAPQ
jgi:glycosyltransferase involved in cell wall biosynthesis